MSDCLVVGGGVIGLSLAYDLAGRGMRVRVIDAGQPGGEASWAGAGILPPASRASDDPLEQLTALSNELHVLWSQELRETTGIDNGFRRCGALYLARDAAGASHLEGFAAWARSRQIAAERLTPQALGQLEPGLRPSGSVAAAYLVPDECQLRNPRHLKALLVGCTGRGVQITAGAAAEDFEIRGGRVRAVRTTIGLIAADRVCVTAGAWTGTLAQKLNVFPAIKPIRGQMVLLSLKKLIVERIINEGRRYLVPRPDGRLLVGSTEEDVGFDRANTAGAISGLLEFALSLAPGLAAGQIERTWTGFRPATADGLPYLGRLPDLENAFLAAGHFRSGLQLSSGTAVLLSQLIRGEQPTIDLSPFAPNRDAAPSSPSTVKRPRHPVH